MVDTLEEARTQTQKTLGDDTDVSYITQDLLDHHRHSQIKEVDKASFGLAVEAANFVFHDGYFWWYLKCDPHQGQKAHRAHIETRLSNCTNGFVRHRIIVDAF